MREAKLLKRSLAKVKTGAKNKVGRREICLSTGRKSHSVQGIPRKEGAMGLG